MQNVNIKQSGGGRGGGGGGGGGGGEEKSLGRGTNWSKKKYKNANYQQESNASNVYEIDPNHHHRLYSPGWALASSMKWISEENKTLKKMLARRNESWEKEELGFGNGS